MDQLADIADMLRWFPFYYGATVVLSCLVIVEMLVWIFNFRGGFGWQDHPKLEFNWHSFLMIVAYIILYGHGILIFRFLRHKPKMSLKIAHAVIMMLALVLAGIGLKAAWDSHDLNTPEPYPNMYTAHSWIGLVTVILFAMQWVFGFVAYLLPWVAMSIRSWYLSLHVFGGLVIFGLATATCMMGFLEKGIYIGAYKNDLTPEGILVNTTMLTVSLLAGLVAYMATKWEFKRQPLPIDTGKPEKQANGE